MGKWEPGKKGEGSQNRKEELTRIFEKHRHCWMAGLDDVRENSVARLQDASASLVVRF